MGVRVFAFEEGFGDVFDDILGDLEVEGLELFVEVVVLMLDVGDGVGV